jgi:hypothetical protein
MSYRVIGNYRPDAKVYASPMQYGTTWSSDVDWAYEIIQGLPYSATETHSKKIVASGKVKVPVSGDYYWPCLVIQDSMHFEDNFGDNDTRWLYEWVVPGAFSGANGVAAALSQSDANRDFTDVATMMQLAVSSIPNWDVRPPAFSHTREWQDTTFVGPYVVWSVIQDNDVVGQESLLYRVDSAAWAGTAPDSSRADTFYFTIPSVAHSSRVDYYVWARDSFCTANNVDLWTTWPVCSPESTMITFHVNIPGTAEQQPAMPGHIGLSASPNPFGGATTFYFNYPNVRRATVKVFASSGELVRTLAMWPVPTLGFQARWDGRNDMGEPVPAGTYLCRVECPGYTEVQKITLTR